jgi:hypothetical protein
MALRRQQLSFDDWVHKEFYHQTTPRKWRTRAHAKTYTPSILYRNRRSYSPGPGTEEHSWIGKKLLYWTGDSVCSYVKANRMRSYGKDSIGEYEIARFARSGTYRIIFVDDQGNWRSKPEVSYRPGRMNLLVNPRDIIVGVSYF